MKAYEPASAKMARAESQEEAEARKLPQAKEQHMQSCENVRNTVRGEQRIK